MKNKETRNYKVYMHTNKINNKRYIGITMKSVNVRWRNGKGYSQSRHFYSAIQKYGWNNFEHEILFCNLTQEEACMFECELIKYYNSNDQDFGYNLESGGIKGTKSHSSTKKLISKISTEQQKKNRKPIICLETKEIFESITHASKQTGINREQIRDTVNKKQKTVRGFHFLFLNEYDNSKEYNLQEKHKLPPFSRKVICLETKQVFNSVRDAGETMGVSKQGVSRVCNNDCRTTSGYHFKFLDEYNEEENYNLIKPHNLFKKVICNETKEIFESISDTARKLGISRGRMKQIIQGQIQRNGFTYSIYTGDAK